MGPDSPALFPLSLLLSLDSAFSLTPGIICSHFSLTRKILSLFSLWTALRSFLYESCLYSTLIILHNLYLSFPYGYFFGENSLWCVFPLQISVKNCQVAKGLLKSAPEPMSLKGSVTSPLAAIPPLLGMVNARSLCVSAKLSLILSQNALLWIPRQCRWWSYHRLQSVKLKWFLKVIKPNPFIL